MKRRCKAEEENQDRRNHHDGGRTRQCPVPAESGREVVIAGDHCEQFLFRQKYRSHQEFIPDAQSHNQTQQSRRQATTEEQ